MEGIKISTLLVDDVRKLVEIAGENDLLQYMFNNPIEDPELLQAAVEVKNKKSNGSKGKSKGNKERSKGSKGNKSAGSKGGKERSKGNKSGGSKGDKQKSKGSKGNKSGGSKGNKQKSKGSKGNQMASRDSKGREGNINSSLVAEIQQKVKEYVEKQKPGT
ncbi:hypothetical protein [Ureibacillus sp. FSL W7-1570]|uniref:hypothetical protein n=1 Tax=Ureibacillus sp. FSL W7-1570 TaxID=2954593 RepID=UPI00315A50C4